LVMTYTCNLLDPFSFWLRVLSFPISQGLRLNLYT